MMFWIKEEKRDKENLSEEEEKKEREKRQDETNNERMKIISKCINLSLSFVLLLGKQSEAPPRKLNIFIVFSCFLFFSLSLFFYEPILL